MMPVRQDLIQLRLVTSLDMSTRLTKAAVERIAALAHLDLTKDETDLFTIQLAKILEYAERLQDVDTSAISATWHPARASAGLRPDTPRPSLAQEDALKNAPDAAPEGLFRVPKVLG